MGEVDGAIEGGGVAEGTGDHGCSRPGLRDPEGDGAAEICSLPLLE